MHLILNVITSGYGVYTYSLSSVEYAINLLKTKPEQIISLESINLGEGLCAVNAKINLNILADSAPFKLISDIYYNDELIDSYDFDEGYLKYYSNENGDIFGRNLSMYGYCKSYKILKPTIQGFVEAAIISIVDDTCGVAD